MTLVTSVHRYLLGKLLSSIQKTRGSESKPPGSEYVQPPNPACAMGLATSAASHGCGSIFPPQAAQGFPGISFLHGHADRDFRCRISCLSLGQPRCLFRRILAL